MVTKNKILLGLVAMVVVLDFLVFKEVFMLAGPRYLNVEILDVGQGDSIFIRTPAHRNIVIDGGPDAAVLSKLSGRLPFWQKSLDVVILTHPDADHLMGILEILKKYKADYIVWTGMEREGANYQEWLSLLQKAKERGSQIIIAKPGLVITSGGAAVEVLHPFENLEGQFFKEANDTGIVARLAYGKKSFLFTADISSKVEEQLVTAGGVASDVLKVAHHGSKYSSFESFLQAVNPKVAVISVGGENTYGHPTPEVLQRLAKFGITVLRTDQRGDIKFVSDGEKIQIK
ncbi:MAG: hypothetical protein A2822_00760 [Candidatus Staskawiczbacteria bacterium RIFCSPHIGHO2_01_FULL_41_41]|uniref:Metallo-beta-lactamase domain-containing protein n=1 Tax=Candidatus Staskawiczbacteria bacterium RIFCSPHIGHO2_01_FULL_41_41 TaxID=1802203 RepID=A0A1G2HWW4_9BACT|nr:MAG: hypothetical protein A2822_00760 [Candidatus Staskawiczbacteria bacterium RIFCSPHIGHO2_01_FULL_41_41]